jgi:hypothetical protein
MNNRKMKMTKTLIGTLLCGVLFACDNEPKTTESSPNLTNVQNVNGNLPDTSSGISLENKQAVDSLSVSDSLKNKH